MPINQDNIITRKEIHVNPTLWRDKIYYLERNPYWNNAYDFIPTPKKYARIIQEFHAEIDKQKQQVKETEEKKHEARKRIPKIKKELKEWIETIIATYDSQPKPLEQAKIIKLQLVLEFLTFKQWKDWSENNLPQEKIISQELGAETEEEEMIIPEWLFTEGSTSEKQEVREKLAPKIIKQLIKEWEGKLEQIKTNYNSCFILEHSDSSLTFTFQPPRQIFTNLKDFLFYRNNTWYEVVSWQRINSWNAVIVAKRSTFLSYYHYFLASGANGIMHCSPRIGREICQCPTFLESNQTEEYASDWEPHYWMFKIKSGLGGNLRSSLPSLPQHLIGESIRNILGTGRQEDEQSAPYINTVELERVEYLNLADVLKDNTYLLLPKGYNDKKVYWSNSKSALGEKIKFSNEQLGEFNEKTWEKHTGNELNHHTKGHFNLQIFWRKKIIGKYDLNHFDPDNCFLKIKANGSAILYTLTSKNIFLQWSEDVKMTVEKNKMIGLFSGAVQKITGINLSEATKSLFHDLNTTESKSQDERESERRTKYDGTAQVVSSVMGSLPSMFASSHTKHDYTSAEFALRYEAPSLKIRIQYNHNTFDRYKMEKTLKRNGNEWFNWEKIGNYLNKGYWKIVPHVFEYDKEGFFAGIFSKGVYLYENHPHEYFTTKLEGGKYSNSVLVGGNPQIETIFQTDLEETGGYDDRSQAGGGLWVYKKSYIRKKDGTGGNVFETLMNQANSYRNHSYEDESKWVFRHPQQPWSTEITTDEETWYEYDLHFFSSDHSNNHGVKGAKKIIAYQVSEGDRSTIKVRFIGEMEIKKGQDDPNEIGTTLPGSGGTEQMPEINPEQNDEAIDGLEKINQPEGEQTNEQDKELLEELQKQNEQTQEKTDEKNDELEPDPDKNKDKARQDEQKREDVKEDEDEDDVERSGNER